jgi:hypothetical protein
MPAIYPPITIEAPPVERYSGGLYSVAPPRTGPVVDGEPRRWENGIQYQSETCADPSTWAVTCPDDVERATKEATLELPLVSGTPFVAYLGINCSLPGKTLEDFRRLVYNALDLCEQRAVERTFWTGDMGNDAHLADGVYDPILNPDGVEILGTSDVTALGVMQGVGALESWLGENYCGVGILHAPRGLAPYAANFQLIREGSGSQLLTPLKTRWAFGGGYVENTGPDGTEAAEGTAWIYATGQVNIWRSDIWIQPDELQQAFAMRTNTVEMFAERAFVITKECRTAAVRVRLDCAC